MKKLLSIILLSAVIFTATACSYTEPPECEPGNMHSYSSTSFSIMKGKEGYYHRGNYQVSGYHYVSGVPLYFDNETGKSTVLCSKPQCLHDGNEFCAASAKEDSAIINLSAFSLYDGYIYNLYNLRRLDEEGHLDSIYEIKLKRYDLQGNECSDLGAIVKLAVEEGKSMANVNQHLYHRGKLFYTMSWYDEGELFMFGLKSRENKKIEIPPNAEGGRNNGPSDLTADGDYLYYDIRYTKYRKNSMMTENDVVYDDTVLRRYNIKTGETEVVSGMPDIYASFTVNDGIVYYTTIDGVNNTFSLYSYDIAEDKNTTLAENLQQDYLNRYHFNGGVQITTDREYLYISTGCSNSNDQDSPDYENDFYIYSLDGEQLLHGLKALPADIPEWQYDMNVLDGEIYLDFDDRSRTNNDTSDMISGVYMMKTEDLINGSTEWKKLYKEG